MPLGKRVQALPGNELLRDLPLELNAVGTLSGHGFHPLKAMARRRSHSIEFKRQVAQEFIAGESLYALSKRHDISRQLIRVWVQSMKRAAWTKTPRLPIYCRNTKPRLRRWSAWLADKRSKSSS